MPAVITLKKLHTEGRLSIGDILNHSERGDHELVSVLDNHRICVKDLQGRYYHWEIDFGPDAKLVRVN